MEHETVALNILVNYLHEFLKIAEIKDYPGAWNGLQVEGRQEIRKVGAAVDASAAASVEAARREIDLLLVHHGLFWDPHRPLVGRYLSRIAPLLQHGISIYAAH